MPATIQAESVKLGSASEDVESPHRDKLAPTTFAEGNDQELQKLQGNIEAIAAKLNVAVHEPYREAAEQLLGELRVLFGRIAQFSKGDFRKDPGFYLGQIHALSELSASTIRQKLPREAVALVHGKTSAIPVLSTVDKQESIGASELAKKVGMLESNLSHLCKELVTQGLLRADRFGKRVRYSATPMARAVLETVPANTPDLSKTMAEAAAASLDPGNVMSNTSDFASGVMALCAMHGADAVVIDPAQNEVRMEAPGTSKSSMLPPPSVRSILSQQARVFMSRSSVFGAKAQEFDWVGQRVRIKKEPAENGESLRLEFLNRPASPTWRHKILVAYQEIEGEKERLNEFEKFYVNEVVAAMGPKSAAETLGLKPIELKSKMEQRKA
jgi:DNA-binding MarR family transcriptional regulator